MIVNLTSNNLLNIYIYIFQLCTLRSQLSLAKKQLTDIQEENLILKEKSNNACVSIFLIARFMDAKLWMNEFLNSNSFCQIKQIDPSQVFGWLRDKTSWNKIFEFDANSSFGQLTEAFTHIMK